MLASLQNPPRKRWTGAECELLEAAGIFDQQPVELVEGELIDKIGKTRPEVDAASLLTGWLIQIFGPRRWNYTAPIDVAPKDNPTNQPVPDLIVLKREYSGFRSAASQPKDLDLVVEISDTSLAFDLTVKAALSARAAIAEYWVLDVPGRRLIVHCNPRDGQYGSVTAYNEQEGVAPLAAPDSIFQVQDVFPK